MVNEVIVVHGPVDGVGRVKVVGRKIELVKERCIGWVAMRRADARHLNIAAARGRWVTDRPAVRGGVRLAYLHSPHAVRMDASPRS